MKESCILIEMKEMVEKNLTWNERKVYMWVTLQAVNHRTHKGHQAGGRRKGFPNNEDISIASRRLPIL
jgi:hypothetical protein